MNLDLTTMPPGCHSLCPCPFAVQARRELGHVSPAEYRRQRMTWPMVEPADHSYRLLTVVRIAKETPHD